MKNRIIALLMVLSLVVLCLASCGEGGIFPGPGPGPKPGPDDENSKYPWGKTQLVFQMTDNSNYQELPSTCRRYLAGDLKGVSDISTIDDYVSDRNDAALKEANVEIEYRYYPEGEAYSWSKSIDVITEEVTGRAAGRPDMYCNFVYDMVAISLNGAFANLYSTTMYEDGHELAGADHNYFEFAKDINYVDTGKDYMYEYMRSLTLSKWKMYCLSSDYFTDMVRAFFVVPVNIQLLESLNTGTDGWNNDRVDTYDKDGNLIEKYTIEDFYQLVTDMEWNYETLAKFSQAITMDGEDGDEAINLKDTVGFALGTASGLSASGMLYTTSVVVIDREYDTVTGDYTYSYPYTKPTTDANGKVTGFVRDTEAGTHTELIDFCDKLNTLMSAKGVIAVNNTDGTQGYGDTDLQAIRNRFASDNVLFGGVICLGSLEREEYKAMNADGKKGYGIAPVPLYRTNWTDANGEVKVDKYLTQIHNLGRIGAISYTTENFAQCTAYLNYQSMHSNEILNEYYDYKLQYDVVGTSVTGNVEMLKYIRNNVRSSFDKAFEDALGRFYNNVDAESMDEQWHTMIKNANFKFTDMAQQYDSLTPEKALRLYNLETITYSRLPE